MLGFQTTQLSKYGITSSLQQPYWLLQACYRQVMEPELN
jgi:hypothetical protein